VEWNSAEQLAKVQLTNGNNDLRIILNSFKEVELYLMVYYSMGKKASYRKLKV
jgi:hypothetical protein